MTEKEKAIAKEKARKLKMKKLSAKLARGSIIRPKNIKG